MGVLLETGIGRVDAALAWSTATWVSCHHLLGNKVGLPALISARDRHGDRPSMFDVPGDLWTGRPEKG